MLSRFASNEIFSMKWLGPVVGLVREHDFEEAFTLAEYYPATSGRHLVQIASLLGRYARSLSVLELKISKQAEQALKDCEVIAKNIQTEDRNQPHDFAHLVNELSPTLLETVYGAALKSKRFHLAQVCLASIQLLNPEDSNARAVEWLDLAQACFAQGEVGLCETRLKHLFSLQYDTAYVIQNFSDCSNLRTRQQLMKVLRDKGWVLSQERSGELFAELFKTDLELSKDDIEKINSDIESFPHNLRARFGAGLAHQEILILQHICADFANAEDRLAEAINAVERLASRGIDTNQLVSESREIENIIRTAERQFGLKVKQREALVFRIGRINELLVPYLRELSAVQSLFYDLERMLHISERLHSEVDFDRETRALDRLKRFVEREFFIAQSSHREPAMFLGFDQIADAIERLQTDWVSRLPRELTNLATNVKRTRVFLQGFSDDSQQALQDPASYVHILNQLPEIRKQEEVVQQEFLKLRADLFGTYYQRLRPAFSKVLDFREASSWASVSAGGSAAAACERSSVDMMEAHEVFIREEPPPTYTLERYTKINFPETCTLDKKVELRIQLTRQLPTLTRMLRKLILSVGIGVKEVKLIVVVTAPGFALQGSQQFMVMPVDGDSEEIVFKLYPAERGNQLVEIEFFYENSRVGHVLVKTYVGYWPDQKSTESIALLRDPAKSLQSTRPDQFLRKLVLHVTWLSRVGELRYKLPALYPSDEWVQSAPDLKSQIEDSLRELNAFLTEAVSSVPLTKQFWASICLNLQAKGAFLFDTLIPPRVGELLASWPADSILAISTNEQWIPWELMFDGQGFWGRKYILTRYPRPSDHTKWPEESAEHGDSRVIQKVVNVIGGGLQEDDSTRALRLFDSVAARVEIKNLRERAVAELSSAVATTDVLHCTCHGLLNPQLLRVAKDSSRVQNLAPETIRVLPLQVGSLVFANACSSAAAALLFGTFNSFGWEFYVKGAEVFIGTLGAVPTKYAIEFAETIYAHLFNTNQSVSVGQALMLARQEAEKKQNIFWLLYCVYGDPDYSVKFK